MSESAPEIRASDTDRDRVAKLLQEHFAQGRLDNEEFSARLERAYKARTVGELQPLTRDLPERDLTEPRGARYRAAAGEVRRAEGAAVERPAQVGDLLKDPALLIPWGLWAGVNTICFSVWSILFLTGTTGGYPWFLWVLVPWGMIMLLITLALLFTRTGSGRPEGD
ncbi:putative membrane protein [Nocardiopsis mwathae]|uniref:Putative membrane protein n=1 Tax=Nocardiopsis mwathae TaxID=1472723 RepID=A0A7W9YD43_9ACTN|nr:putative membrane protein [Nocardiopsis mwathae]